MKAQECGIKSQLASIILQLLQRKEKKEKEKEAPRFKAVHAPSSPNKGQGLLSNILR